MIKFSVIIPVYNRPEEIVELLDSLTMQSIKTEMEVIVVEDGSSRTCRSEVEQFTKQLTIKYIYQENAGPGLARNHGAEYARGEYMLFFDSDCVIPSDYFVNTLEFLSSNDLDCFGGPDRAHAFFTSVQKAISYSMTSLLTTGGIRGGRKKLDKFYPRSFNLGVKSDVFRALGGFSDMRYGEDLDFSMNAIEHGYKVGLITDTFVYHKRRNTFCSFYKQVFSSGSARVELTRRHPGTLKLVHVLPSFFAVGVPVLLMLSAVLSGWLALPVALWVAVILVHSWMTTKSLSVAMLSVVASFIQIMGYGYGFITTLLFKLRHRNSNYVAFRKTFYN